MLDGSCFECSSNQNRLENSNKQFNNDSRLACSKRKIIFEELGTGNEYTAGTHMEWNVDRCVVRCDISITLFPLHFFFHLVFCVFLEMAFGSCTFFDSLSMLFEWNSKHLWWFLVIDSIGMYILVHGSTTTYTHRTPTNQWIFSTINRHNHCFVCLLIGFRAIVAIYKMRTFYQVSIP